jgi:3-oxoacyl-[acyl-carrier-protein] synthase-3
VYIAGVAAHIPDLFPAKRAVELGWYDQGEYERGGWESAAVAGEVSAPELAARAAAVALRRSGHRSADIRLVLHASSSHQGPDSWVAAQYVQRECLGGRAPAMDIRQTCNGMLAAAHLAACWLACADGSGAALITGADNFGHPLIDRWTYSSGVNTNRGSVLGDAGTALVLSRRGGFARLLAITTRSLPELEVMYRGGRPMFPPECTVGRPLDYGDRIATYAAGDPEALPEALGQLSRARTEVARRALAEAGVPASAVTRVTHVFTGGEGYVRHILEPLGIDPARGMFPYGRELGHLGVCDQVAGLDHLVGTGEVGAGDHVLMMSNGAGASVAAAVVAVSDVPAWSAGHPG